MQTLRVDGIYGKTTDGSAQPKVTFVLRKPAASSSDLFYISTGATISNAEIFIYHDGVYFGTATNNATKVVDGGTGTDAAIYTLVLTASEMTAEKVDIVLHSATTAYRDLHIQIRTKFRIGQILVDASQISNGDAMQLTGAGTGKSINANKDIYTATKLSVTGNFEIGGNLAVTGNETAAAMTLTGNLSVGGNFAVTGDLLVTGDFSANSIIGILSSMVLRTGTATAGAAGSITLDAGASTTADYYKTSIVMITGGTGSGQARIITAYSTGRVATVNRNWAVNPANDSVFVILPGYDIWNFAPAAEIGNAGGGSLIAAPSAGVAIQALYQRFFFKRTQTAAVQTMYKSDNSSLATCSVDDNGVTETVGAYI